MSREQTLIDAGCPGEVADQFAELPGIDIPDILRVAALPNVNWYALLTLVTQYTAAILPLILALFGQQSLPNPLPVTLPPPKVR